MPIDTKGTISAWASHLSTVLNPLRNNTTVDVVVVGAGIAGLSVAYALIERGKSIIVLDDGPIGGGETSRTTAHLVTALDRRYRTIERMHGPEAARLCAQSHGEAIDRIEAISSREGIECDFLRLDGFLLVPVGQEENATTLVSEEHAAATRAGARCAIIPRAPGVAIPTGPCLGFTNQAQFHPMKFIHGLARLIHARGGKIHTGSHAQTIRGGKEPKVVTSDGYTVRAGAIVVATNSPVNDLVTMHTKQVACRTYVLGFRVPRGVIPPALYWDGFWDDHDEPYHYVRLMCDSTSEHELLIVGGEDHKTGREHDHQARYDRLEQWGRSMFPEVQQIDFRWSGQIMEPHDEVAFIGCNPHDDNVYIVTGDSGNGMTHAAIAGIMLPDLIDGEDHPWKNLYSPSRLPAAAASIAIAEAAEMVSEYRDWVTPHSPHQLDVLEPGQGVVIRVRGKLQAIYKNAEGELVRRSAVCPHLRGIVRWNATERSWDCPCHGSRFDCQGGVIDGPANTGLDEIPASEQQVNEESTHA